MILTARARCSGLTLVEVAVVVVLIGILAGLALQRVIPLIGKAEVVAFLTVKNQLNSALMMETAKRIASGRSRLVPRLENSNPMKLLFEPPENYLGEMSLPKHEDLPPRSWYFDRVTDKLFYRVGDTQRFGISDSVIGFQVQLSVRDPYPDESQAMAEEIVGVRLVSNEALQLTY